MRRLTACAAGKGARVYAPTILDTTKALENIDECDILIVHTSVNDLKSKRAEQVVSEYENFIAKARGTRVRSIIVSLPTPSLTKPWDQKISYFNRTIIHKLRDLPKITLCTNSNFLSYGSPIDRLFSDNIHLSPEGTRLLSGNLIHTMFGTKSKHRHVYYNDNENFINTNRKENIAAEIARATVSVL